MATPTLVQFAHNQEAFSTSQGMAVKFPSAVGANNTLITVVIGKKNPNPYNAGNTTQADGSMDTNTPAPVITKGDGTTTTGWVAATAFKSIDAKVAAGTLFTDESKPDFVADYPAVYVSHKVPGVLAGETIVVKSAFKGPQASPSQDANGAAGVSIFQGGVNVVALEFSGINATPAAVEQHQLTTTNPALSASGTTGSSGDLMIAVGYQKNGNVFAPSSGWTVIYSDKCVTSQDHFVVAYKVLSGADHASFSNPLGYEMAVAALKLAHS